MTDYEKARQRGILETKLKLWSTPGFNTFLQDLTDLAGEEKNLSSIIDSLKKIYVTNLKEVAPKSKYVQTELFDK